MGTLDNYSDNELAKIVRKHAVRIPKRAIFITVDSISGAGKTTLVDELYNKFCSITRKVEKVKDSEFGIFADAIQKYRREGGPACKDSLILAHIYAANRRSTIASGELEEKLMKNDVLIFNRYFLTTFVRQIADGVKPSKILSISDKSYVVPDVCVILKCDPTIANSRVSRRDETSAYNREKIARIQSIYGELAKLTYCLEIDTSLTGVLPKDSPELHLAVQPFVDKVFDRYLIKSKK